MAPAVPGRQGCQRECQTIRNMAVWHPSEPTGGAQPKLRTRDVQGLHTDKTMPDLLTGRANSTCRRPACCIQPTHALAVTGSQVQSEPRKLQRLCLVIFLS
ncbi:hypothetical protein PVAP13_3NG130585 [Panicum virgatum]|uniref:Uncharacterized protein n=1 Tax=Panicum virgatum TaxID=38727 RepID=A0A8T0TW11_PANVG|nr:hypothetical protein PVAP13_3NG130585 [Panicum virgatum]